MAASIRNKFIYDPAPAAGFYVDTGTSNGGIVVGVSADTVAGNTLACVAVCSYDLNNSISSVSDSVNGAWTLVQHILDATYTNSDYTSYHFPNAAALKATAASFTGSVNGTSQVLTASAVTGTIRVGQLLKGASVGAMWRIKSQLTGTTGGAGTYQLNAIATTSIASEAMTTADAITVDYVGAPDYNALVAWEVQAASTSGVTAHAGQAIDAGGTDAITTGTAACGTSPGIMLALAANGTTATSPYAPTEGTGFTSDGDVWQWNLGQADANIEHQHFANPGTVAATWTPSGTDGFVAMMVFIPDASGGGVIASAAPTEAADAVAAQGGIIVPAASAVVEGHDVITSSGTLTLSGSAAIIEQNDAAAATGAVSITGAARIVEAAEAVTSIGALSISSAAWIIEISDAMVASGSLSVAGSAAVTEARDANAAAGGLSLTGAAVILEPPDIGSAAAAAGAALSGDISESPDAAIVSGALSVAASATISERSDAASAQGALAIVGFAAILEAPDGIVASAAAGAAGSAAIKESADAASAAGMLSVSASAAVAEPADIVRAVGALSISASVAVVESPDVVAATHQTSITTSVAITESSDVAAATAYFGTPVKAGAIPLTILANQSSVALAQNNSSLQVIQ